MVTALGTLSIWSSELPNKVGNHCGSYFADGTIAKDDEMDMQLK